MAQFIQQPTIIKEVTKEGEITINLVLTVKLENGSVPEKPKTYTVDEVDDFLVPDIKNEALVQFGKKV